MTEQLGKIEKPEAERFARKRKLYLVPLIFSSESAPAEYTEKFERYWQQVSEHVANLESKIGKVSHVYHEAVTLSGEEGLKLLEKLSPPSSRLTRERLKEGATLEAAEDKELADESIDWERHILIGFISEKVAKTVTEFYLTAYRKRYEFITRKIDETLGADEAGILFIREGQIVQFPGDIEVFSVSPPALDEIRRWQRDHAAVEEERAPEEKKEPAPEQQSGGSGTP